MKTVTIRIGVVSLSCRHMEAIPVRRKFDSQVSAFCRECNRSSRILRRQALDLNIQDWTVNNTGKA